MVLHFPSVYSIQHYALLPYLGLRDSDILLPPVREIRIYHVLSLRRSETLGLVSLWFCGTVDFGLLFSLVYSCLRGSGVAGFGILIPPSPGDAEFQSPSFPLLKTSCLKSFPNLTYAWPVISLIKFISS
ncbi:hypothetical protein SUGI_0813390 [Cryptomeria japonica]|nr:hypothetical protein SUGI_0813390 [Cryptomeria japonica]